MASNSNGERSGNSATVTTKRGRSKTSNTANINSEKPKQPQRGLGVAQLEKIRLHSQMVNSGVLPHHQVPAPPPHHLPGFIHPSFQHVPEYQFGYQQVAAPPPRPPPTPPFCYSSPQVASSSYDYHHPNAFMIGMKDHMERYSESQPINTARWNPSNNFRATPETQPYPYPSGMITRHLLSHVEQQNGSSNFYESKSSSSQNSDSNRNEEVDLELKL